MRVRGIPGLSFALVIEGKLVAVEALGVSDFWTRESLTPDTLMEVASDTHGGVGSDLAAVACITGRCPGLANPDTAGKTNVRISGCCRSAGQRSGYAG